MEVKHVTVEREGSKVVTAYINGNQYTAHETHPQFKKIMEKLFEGNHSGLTDLFNEDKAVESRFKKISDRVSVKDGHVYFDNDAIENELSEHLLRLIHSGENEEDIKYLVNFWEKVATNPNQHSRDHLMRWLNTHDFSITPDGDLVAYKGLNSDGDSIHAGPGIVDGVQMNGHLPNRVGSVIEMSRESVEHDPGRGCAFGLHVGTYDYAKSFGGNGVKVEVVVNPRDVVSVPVDSNHAKVRVCRYTVKRVMGENDGKRQEAVVNYEPVVVDNDFTLDSSKGWVNVGYIDEVGNQRSDWA